MIVQEVETGDQLKQWREDQFLTQLQLATLLDVHVTTVARWEIGTRRIPGTLRLALEQLAGQRQRLVQRLRRVQEKLAHERRLKAIAQGKYRQARHAKEASHGS